MQLKIISLSIFQFSKLLLAQEIMEITVVKEDLLNMLINIKRIMEFLININILLEDEIKNAECKQTDLNYQDMFKFLQKIMISY